VGDLHRRFEANDPGGTLSEWAARIIDSTVLGDLSSSSIAKTPSERTAVCGLQGGLGLLKLLFQRARLVGSHYDHIAGLDELRIYTFRQKRPVPCLLSRETYDELKIRYHYFLPKDSVHDTKLKFSILDEESGKTMFQGLNVEYFSYVQIGMKVNGFRWPTTKSSLIPLAVF